ncbi:SPP1 (YPL138C) [Zygosaccharomyces parabailii]|nr:SPP1 (YPL138C) [Zygosaccharomyces parabailii]CDH08755.1 related to COMPASS component SPP1 [Zygosaccharomyces bailii ISA1307]
MSLPAWCPPYSSRKTGANGEDVYCICKRPDNGDLMVGCDGCDDWFHFRCLKIPETYKKLVYSFYCPYCQAGVTGPASNGSQDLPRTIWKRKCRLNTCYKPCQPNSKYCSEELGELYMKTALAKVEIPGISGNAEEQLVKDMVKTGSKVEEFKMLGNDGFINKEPPGDNALYDEMIAHDRRLHELQNNVRELEDVTIMTTKTRLEGLNNYVKWLENVNAMLASQGNLNIDDDATNAKSRKKSAKNKQKKCICGYTSDYNIPCPAEEFVTEYRPDIPTLRGICVKIRCNKHLSWAIMQMEELEQQLSSLESYENRLRLLVKMRKEQLHIQYYEQLLRRNK